MNTSFKANSYNKIISILKYCKGFIKDETLRNSDDLKRITSVAIENLLPELPDRPNLILEEIRQVFPFELPIKKHSDT